MTEDLIQCLLVRNGPVTIGVNAAFRKYKNYGVFRDLDNTCGPHTEHAVLLGTLDKTSVIKTLVLINCL